MKKKWKLGCIPHCTFKTNHCQSITASRKIALAPYPHQPIQYLQYGQHSVTGPPSMDVTIYPGKGLSLSLLAFALNKELKRVAYSPSYVAKYNIMILLAKPWADFFCSFTFDDVSQLDEDISTTLANVREWRNSFVHINRIPLDVLSLIPTHFDSQGDILNANGVCRYWRKTFLQHAALWSRLVLSKGETCVRTFLERAKGTALDVITRCGDPVMTMSLLFPHTQQIRSLHVVRNLWADVQKVSNINSGPLPLLRTLEISVQATDRANLSLPLFGGAANLKQLILSSPGSPLLSLFVFPNLTTFKLQTTWAMKNLRVSELLDFLEASPMLRAVDLVIADTSLEGLAQRKTVVLPNVQTFSLIMEDYRTPYQLITYMSCPSVTRTSLIHKKEFAYSSFAGNIRDMFPTAASWNTIVRQYTRSPVEAVAFYIKTYADPAMSCTLAFRSSDTTLLLGIEVSHDDPNPIENELQIFLEDIGSEIFSQGFRVVRDHPLLSNIKHLHILDDTPALEAIQPRYTVDEMREPFESMGPLEGLTLHGCDPHSYFAPFLTDLLGLKEMEQPITYPPIKELAILHPSIDADLEDRVETIVEFAKLQHALGVPFGRVTVRAKRLPVGAAEMLRPWVGVVDCCEDPWAPLFGDKYLVSASVT